VNRWYDEVFEDRIRFGLKVREHLYSARSPFQEIEIIDTEPFGRTLVLDGVFMTSEADEFYYHEMLVHPALNTAPRIARVLVIGGGDGGAVREVCRHPEVQRVVMVEIDRMVVEACREYLPAVGTAWNDPRLEIRFEDGVRYVREAAVEPFDVILVDGSDPAGPAEGLFDEAFYRGCERLLTSNGVLALQSESPVLFREVFAEIVSVLRRVFGRAHPYLGSVPLYAAGMWTWTYATRSIDPMDLVDERVERIESETRYYNREIHEAAFALPNNVKRLID
jgi:spermidine synthase